MWTSKFFIRFHVLKLKHSNGLHVPTTSHPSFNVLLTVHLGITLVNGQLDAQFFYFIIHLLQSSTCFEQRRAHHQEVKFY